MNAVINPGTLIEMQKTNLKTYEKFAKFIKGVV